MISVTGPLWLWSGESANWHFLTVPAELSNDLRAESRARPGGFGSVRVQARIGETVWRTSVFPQKSGGYILPVKASVRRDAGIAAGDQVIVEIEVL